MYSKLIFCEFINKVEDVSLPAIVPTKSGSQKTEFAQLEVNLIEVYNLHVIHLGFYYL